jgi:hypothetical protein
MTEDEVRMLKLSSAFVASYLRDDARGQDAAFTAASSDLSPIINGTFLLAISLASIYGHPKGESVETTLRNLTEAWVDFIPEVGVNWEVGIQIAAAKSAGSADLAAVTRQIDIPTAFQTAVSLVVALLWAMDGVNGRDSFEWLQFVIRYLLDEGADGK